MCVSDGILPFVCLELFFSFPFSFVLLPGPFYGGVVVAGKDRKGNRKNESLETPLWFQSGVDIIGMRKLLVGRSICLRTVVAVVVIEPAVALGTEDAWGPPETKISERRPLAISPVNVPALTAIVILK